MMEFRYFFAVVIRSFIRVFGTHTLVSSPFLVILS